ncbi:hypothetical protein BDK51DRAFT_37372 [Blyttiomyces helicus]|uniref:Uncharacterized protein n=1 Tax=Blyttiomyces helicus TaxID=388810 RepID=A0A4P9VWR2_9FUNG|nr:hypothetical protein BDK51DRAFT_37372 [Blyttiomyces helicus]|eukprot:RKO84151.1 hypothetical protein BDK51DRAFT_37372 [Blyttiomyces helicus]
MARVAARTPTGHLLFSSLSRWRCRSLRQFLTAMWSSEGDLAQLAGLFSPSSLPSSPLRRTRSAFTLGGLSLPLPSFGEFPSLSLFSLAGLFDFQGSVGRDDAGADCDDFGEGNVFELGAVGGGGAGDVVRGAEIARLDEAAVGWAAFGLNVPTVSFAAFWQKLQDGTPRILRGGGSGIDDIDSAEANADADEYDDDDEEETPLPSPTPGVTPPPAPAPSAQLPPATPFWSKAWQSLSRAQPSACGHAHALSFLTGDLILLGGMYGSFLTHVDTGRRGWLSMEAILNWDTPDVRIPLESGAGEEDRFVPTG